MSNDIRLIVGLGNPGSEYEQTRHNAGFWFIDELARHFTTPLASESKYFGITGRMPAPYSNTRLLKPMTFMNKSGQSVAPLAHFFKVSPEQVLVVHDELDLPPGIARFKQGGGHGGHNGLKDIIRCFGNNNNFHRLRIGIGHPGHSSRVTGHVLGKPPQSEREAIERIIDESVRAVDLALAKGWVEAKQYLHSVR